MEVIEPTPPIPTAATKPMEISLTKETVPLYQSWWFWITMGAVAIAIVVIIIIIVYTVPRVAVSSAVPSTTPSLCTNQVPLYVHVTSFVNYAFMSMQRSVPNATVQRNGNPEIILCASSGDSRIPLFAYINPNDPADNRWGTSNVAPSYYQIGNGGLPIGYIYATRFVKNGESIKPVYETIHNFNNDFTHTAILSHDPEPTFSGVTYTRISSTPLGYSL